MDKFLNKKIVIPLFLAGGALIIAGVFVLAGKKNEEQVITVSGNSDNNVLPLDGVGAIPQNIVDYNTTTQQTDGTILTTVDTSNFPKPGDNNNTQTKQGSKYNILNDTENTVPQNYLEFFNPPIELKSNSGSVDTGGLITTYKTTEGNLFDLIEGPFELGGFGNPGERILLTKTVDEDNDGELDNVLSYFWTYQSPKGNTSLLWFGDYGDTHRCLTSQQLTKSELVEIATYLIRNP
ncbi:hypothetical protein KKH46_01935 [Patescibacteria group bacterium]|nr:hypothetical protein [Patescibacteria group bacterium]MBU1956099.1 hypothetical protein [Patescibacteria group bacterium]